MTSLKLHWVPAEELSATRRKLQGLIEIPIKSMKSVADKMSTSTRLPDLSFSHHREVAKLEPEKQMAKRFCHGCKILLHNTTTLYPSLQTLQLVAKLFHYLVHSIVYKSVNLLMIVKRYNSI